MRKIISYFLAIIIAITYYMPICVIGSGDVGQIIEIKYFRNIENGKNYAFAVFDTNATAAKGGTTFGTHGWNINFLGFTFRYEVSYNPNTSISYKIPLIDGSGSTVESFQSRIKKSKGEDSNIYKTFISLMKSGGSLTFNAHIQKYDNGQPTGKFADTLEQALSLASWGSNTVEDFKNEYYNRVATVAAQPIITTHTDFTILHNGTNVTDNTTSKIKRTTNTLQLQLKDQSTVENDIITKRDWYVWKNTWVPITAGPNDQALSIDTATLGVTPDRIGFKLVVTTYQGKTDYAVHDVYSENSTGQIIIRHKSDKGATLSPDETIGTALDTPTVIYSKAISGYIADKISDTMTVPATDTDRKVEYTFTYRTPTIDGGASIGTIIVYFKDKAGNAVSDDSTFNVPLDKPFTVYSKAVPNYTSEKQSDILTVPSTDSDKKVEYTFFYTQNPPILNPPIVWIDANNTVFMGEDITIKGGGSDPAGLPIAYIWEVSPGDMMQGTLQGSAGGTVWFSKTGTVHVKLSGTSAGGTAEDTKSIRVLPPYPQVFLKAANSRVNHKIAIDASTSKSSSSRYPIDWSKTVWELSVDNAAPDLAISDIKTKMPHTIENVSDKQVMRINGSYPSIEILSKKPGKLNVYCKLANQAGYESFANMQIDIGPDLAPIAGAAITKTVFREPEDDYYATIEVLDTSSSLDEDTISKRIWFYAFDSDNDEDNKLITRNSDGTLKAVAENEIWYVLDGGQWETVTDYGIDGSYSSLKNLDISKIKDGNLTKVTIRTDHVGRYRVELIVQDSLLQNTIPEFISPQDIKTGNTFDS